MPTTIAQLNRVRGRSFREIRERGLQELSKLGERWLNLRSNVMSDAALMREIAPDMRDRSGEETAAKLAGRIRAFTVAQASSWKTFFPALAHREAIVAEMERRFATERQAIIARADKVCQKRFDLLGFADLSFGDPIDWHLDPTSGKRAPLVHWSSIDFLNAEVAGDKKVTWELNRQQYFVTLGQAYWLTGNERYAEAFVTQASSWMDANPPKIGINWASSLELAFRVISWLWSLHLFVGSRQLVPGFVLRLLKYLVAQGRHIESYLSHYFSPNTHLTGEALGLFYLGTALPELRRAAVWRELGLSILLEQLPVHVRRDGVYFEQSSYYHRYTTDFYTHLIVLARASGLALPQAVEEKLRLLLDHLMWITRPDGSSPLYGDDDGGRLMMLAEREADDFRDTLATGAALFSRGDWKFVAGEASVETLWLLGPEGLADYDGITAQPPRERARAFDDSGYFVMRDGWHRDSSYVLIDCGAHGAMNCGHAHADALSFEFASGGVNWIIDPGTYTYTGDTSVREEFRSTAAHNTATVDGVSQSVPAGPFSWHHVAQATAHGFTSGDGELFFAGQQDGYTRLNDPVSHTRSLRLVKFDGRQETRRNLPAHLIIRDEFNAREEHHYQLRFHFADGCCAEAEENRVTVRAPGNGEMVLATFAAGERSRANGLQARIEQGWVSRCYGRRQPAPVGVFEASGWGRQTFITVLIPVAPGGRVDVEQLIKRWLIEEREANTERVLALI
ncbi:MAG: heparinase II/III family protein [Acidobacteria bacterium]|nr:heparinase II/III family protein [Acidobacteriota bacterium]